MNNKIIKFLNTLKNASLSKKNSLLVDFNTTILKCAEALYKEGLILSYSTLKENGELKIIIKLRNVDDIVLTSKIKFISKPGSIKYLPYYQICRVVLKEKACFFFTSKGILTLEECKKYRVGGALSFYC